MPDVRLDPIDRAVAEIGAGRAVVVMDDERRENEGDLVFAASHASAELLAFTIRHTSGVICVPMSQERLTELDIPLMTARNTESMRTAFTVSVDAARGVTTGISAADRALTIRALADVATTADDLVRPGHVFPLRAHPGGVLGRPGHTEAAVDLTTLAGLPPVGVICELVEDDGTMRRGPSLRAFADEHGLALVSIADLITRRGELGQPVRVAVRPAPPVSRVTTTVLPTRWGEFAAVGFRAVDGAEHLALVRGDVEGAEHVLVRLHSECLTGDVFGSARCDCGQQLEAALDAIAAAGRGVVVYLGGHEGRGIGLLQKLRAYALQDEGLDTVEANLALGWPVDVRDFTVGASILGQLGVQSVRLMTNNPAKEASVRSQGIEVTERVALAVEVTDENRRYLTTKRERMGHALDLPGADRRPA